MPICETEKDRENEQKIADRISLLTGWDLTRTDTTYPCDFICKNALIETRRRKNTLNQYSTIYLSSDKREEIRKIQNEQGIGLFIFAVWFTDGLFYTTADNNYKIKYSARKKQRFKNDGGNVLLIPTNEFRHHKYLAEFKSKYIC